MTDSAASERSERIREEFDQLDDWMDRYRYLVDLGDALDPLPPEERTDETYVHSCQYDLWLKADHDPDEGVVRFQAYSDSQITRGLAAMLIGLLDGQPPEAVAEADLGFLDEMGLSNQLSSQRQNGLSGMIHQMKVKAREHLQDTDGKASDRP